MLSATNVTSTIPSVECETVWQSLCLLFCLLTLSPWVYSMAKLTDRALHKQSKQVVWV